MKIYYNKSCDEFEGEDCFLICSTEYKEIFINISEDSFKLSERDNSLDTSDTENLFNNETFLDAYAASRGFEPVVSIWRLDDKSEYDIIWYNDIFKKDKLKYLKNRLKQFTKNITFKVRQSTFYDNSYNKIISLASKLISKI